MKSKNEIRDEIRQRSKSMTLSELKERSLSLYDRIINETGYQKAKSVFCYVSIQKEPDTRDLIQKILYDGKLLCVPRCREDGTMDAVPLRELSELKPGLFGIPEPPEEIVPVPAENIDLMIVPAMAADLNRNNFFRGFRYSKQARFQF